METNDGAASLVRSDALLANRATVELVLNKLLEEAQERFGCWSALTPEEVKAWIDSRRVHWFANSAISLNSEAYQRAAPDGGKEGK